MDTASTPAAAADRDKLNQRPPAGFFLGRRHLVTGAAVGGALLATADTATAASFGDDDTVAFFGDRQAGVQTPAQQHVSLLGVDLEQVSTDTLTRLLTLLSDDGARLTQGVGALADGEPELASTPHRLTITFGFGPRVQRHLGKPMDPMPAFKTDRLQPRWRQTDLLIQIGCDDPTTLSHAQRVITKDLRTLATITWIQRGFRDRPSTDSGTMRNLMGQVDGTVNPRSLEEFEAIVWRGNVTEVAVRRIAIAQDTWDKVDRVGREFAIGRRLGNGGPLTGGGEFANPDFAATGPAGFPVIDPASHMRRARGEATGPQFLRRGFNYDDTDHGDGVGLLFIAFARSLQEQFVPVQRRLADLDLLNRWVSTVGSAQYVIAAGAAEGDWVGHAEIG